MGRAPARDVPMIVQVSRWDPLKDMLGVMLGFAKMAEAAPDLVFHLAAVGATLPGQLVRTGRQRLVGEPVEHAEDALVVEGAVDAGLQPDPGELLAQPVQAYRYDIPFGVVERPAMALDVPGNSWGAAIPEPAAPVLQIISEIPSSCSGTQMLSDWCSMAGSQ